MAALRSLEHRPFALLWSGQTISRLGDSLHRIAIWLGRLQQIRRRGLLAYTSWITVGLLIVPIGLVNSVAMITIIAIVLGILLSTLNLVWANTLQELVPLDKLGRVASVDQLGSFSLLPIGFGATGWLTDLIGGIITAGLAMLGLLHSGIRNLD